MKVADFTAEELKALIRETVEEVLEEHFGDPDAGLELRDEVKAQLLASEDKPGAPIENVAKELGLTW